MRRYFLDLPFPKNIKLLHWEYKESSLFYSTNSICDYNDFHNKLITRFANKDINKIRNKQVCVLLEDILTLEKEKPYDRKSNFENVEDYYRSIKTLDDLFGEIMDRYGRVNMWSGEEYGDNFLYDPKNLLKPGMNKGRNILIGISLFTIKYPVILNFGNISSNKKKKINFSEILSCDFGELLPNLS